MSISFILGFGGQKKIVVLIIKHLKCFLHFKFQTNLSIFDYSQSYSNEFLLKIETGLSLECDMNLFFSGSHQCLKYLTKTVSPINLNIFLNSQYLKSSHNFNYKFDIMWKTFLKNVCKNSRSDALTIGSKTYFHKKRENFSNFIPLNVKITTYQQISYGNRSDVDCAHF